MTRDSPDSARTLHDERDGESGVEANRIHVQGAETTGIELSNNNIKESPGDTEANLPRQPQTEGVLAVNQHDEKDPNKDWMVKFDGDNDPDNPRSMSTKRKWLITLVVAFSSLCV